MLVHPTLDEVINGERGMLCGIQACLDAQCLVSAVSLVFSTIDALSALTRPKEVLETSQPVFKEWVDRYMLCQRTLRCTADDLYGARCGVLHTYNPESNLQRKRNARRLFYQWRTGPAADATVELPEDAVVIQVETLHATLREAIRRFLVDADADPKIAPLVRHHLPTLLCYKPWPLIEGRIAAA